MEELPKASTKDKILGLLAKMFTGRAVLFTISYTSRSVLSDITDKTHAARVLNGLKYSSIFNDRFDKS